MRCVFVCFGIKLSHGSTRDWDPNNKTGDKRSRYDVTKLNVGRERVRR